VEDEVESLCSAIEMNENKRNTLVAEREVSLRCDEIMMLLLKEINWSFHIVSSI
jgi:hypothetical protein